MMLQTVSDRQKTSELLDYVYVNNIDRKISGASAFIKKNYRQNSIVRAGKHQARCTSAWGLNIIHDGITVMLSK
jgi:hypothetical protein